MLKTIKNFFTSMRLGGVLLLAGVIAYILAALGVAPAVAVAGYITYLYTTYKLQVFVTFFSYGIIMFFEKVMPRIARAIKTIGE